MNRSRVILKLSPMKRNIFKTASQKEIGSRCDDVYLLVLFFLCFLLYFPVLNNLFLLDDGAWIERAMVFEKHPALLFSLKEDGYLRPFLILFFSFVHRLSHLDPTGYYVSLVFLHAVNSLLLYALASYLMAPYSARHRELGFLSALVFLCSLSHYQPVFWIASFTHSFAACFFLASFYLFALYARAGKNSLLIFSVGCYVISLFSRESAFFLPMLLLFVDRKCRKSTLPFFVVAAAHIFLYKFIVLSVSLSAPSSAMLIKNFIKVVLAGIRDLFINQMGFSTVLIPQKDFFHLLGGITLIFLCAVLLLCLLHFRLFLAEVARLLPMLSLSAAWTFLALLPFIFSLITFPEFHRFRYFYLSGTGFSFLFVLLLLALYRTLRSLWRILPLTACGLVLAFSLFANALALRSLSSIFDNYSVLSFETTRTLSTACPMSGSYCRAYLLNFPEKPFLVFGGTHLEKMSFLFSGGKMETKRLSTEKDVRDVLSFPPTGGRNFFLFYTPHGIKHITADKLSKIIHSSFKLFQL